MVHLGSQVGSLPWERPSGDDWGESGWVYGDVLKGERNGFDDSLSLHELNGGSPWYMGDGETMGTWVDMVAERKGQVMPSNSIKSIEQRLELVLSRHKRWSNRPPGSLHDVHGPGERLGSLAEIPQSSEGAF